MLKTTFKISKMDCSSEEQMIRMKLGSIPDIAFLEFDIPGRKLEVYHSGNSDKILAALETLELDSRLLSSEEAGSFEFKYNRNQEIRVLRQVLIINLFFFALEILTGFIAGSMGLSRTVSTCWQTALYMVLP